MNYVLKQSVTEIRQDCDRILFSKSHWKQPKGDITTHFSAAELNELINAAESILNRGRTETPNLMLIGQNTEGTVGKVSEIKKGLTEGIG